MLKPDRADYKLATGVGLLQYKRDMKAYRKEQRVIKKEKLKDELVQMVQGDPANYLDFALPIFRIGLDSYSTKELESFL